MHRIGGEIGQLLRILAEVVKLGLTRLENDEVPRIGGERREPSPGCGPGSRDGGALRQLGDADSGLNLVGLRAIRLAQLRSADRQPRQWSTGSVPGPLVRCGAYRLGDAQASGASIGTFTCSRYRLWPWK